MLSVFTRSPANYSNKENASARTHTTKNIDVDRGASLSQLLSLYPNHQRPLLFNAISPHRGAKAALKGLNIGSFHLFVHPKWSTCTFGKLRF